MDALQGCTLTLFLSVEAAASASSQMSPSLYRSSLLPFQCIVMFIVLQLFTVSRDSPSRCAHYDRANCFTCTLRACVWNMLPIYKSIYRYCHTGYLFVVVVTFCLLSHDNCRCVYCTQWHLSLFSLGAACVHWNTGGRDRSTGVLFS